MRDNFNPKTREALEKAVGSHCSAPDCGCLTAASKGGGGDPMSIGVAAHICAAAPGGPRYDDKQTPEQRRSKDNGIWLCQSCSRKIDADPDTHTVELLYKWKSAAQIKAFKALGVTDPHLTLFSTDQTSQKGSDDLERGDLDQALAAATKDLSGFKTSLLHTDEIVRLTLRILDIDEIVRFDIDRLPTSVEAASEVTLVAPPGMGKTTTLLGLADQVLKERKSVPIFLRLGEWSVHHTDILQHIAERPTFRDVSTDALRELADCGRLLLLLDGWNELDGQTREAIRKSLQALRREFPLLRVIISTRRQWRSVPISGPQVEIEPLSYEQQLAVARQHSDGGAEKVLDEVRRTSGLRELATIPMYLSALLSLGARGVGQITKESILSNIVARHEKSPDHSNALELVTNGCHSYYLELVASRLCESSSTAMPEAIARQVTAQGIQNLRDLGQILAGPEPSHILSALTDHHVLVRSDNEPHDISFQHQQIQEWYASFEVSKLIEKGVSGDLCARKRLLTEIMDRPIWEEPILFAIERLSHAHDGAQNAAHAIRLALSVDPMLAAEMIFNSTEQVWSEVKAEVVGFAERWHEPNHVDRALRFMILTGRSDFAETVWPLVSNTDSQIQLRALRAAPRFRPSVLGTDVVALVASLEEEQRRTLISEIAVHGGIEGIELATEIAKQDPSPQIQAEVLRDLSFRDAEFQFVDLLSNAHEDVWADVFRWATEKRALNVEMVEKLRIKRQAIYEDTASPTEKLRIVISQYHDWNDRDETIATLVADPQFSWGGDSITNIVYSALKDAPDAIREGLRRRVLCGLEVPSFAHDQLFRIDATEDQSVATYLVDDFSNQWDAQYVARVAGPEIVSVLIGRYLEFHASARNDKLSSERTRELRDRLRNTRLPSFLPGLMKWTRTTDVREIAALANLISSYKGNDEQRRRIPVPPEERDEWIEILRSWVSLIVSSDTSQRYDLCEVAKAIGRFGFPELADELKRLIDEELVRLQRAKDGFIQARRAGDVTAASEASMRYGNQYHQALVDLGGERACEVASLYLEDREIGRDAAGVLYVLSKSESDEPERGPFPRWPWLDEMFPARHRRAEQGPLENSETWAADQVFLVVSRLANEVNDDQGQRMAIELCATGLGMPHSNQDELVDRVLALSQPVEFKLRLLSAIALDGRVLNAAIIMSGIDNWLENAERNTWQYRDRAWEIERWLELLPFSNSPEFILEAVETALSIFDQHHPERFERVVHAVAAIPGEDGERLLSELARRQGSIAPGYTWLKAILSRDTASSTELFITLYAEGCFNTDRGSLDGWHAAKELAPYLNSYQEVMERFRNLYEADTNPSVIGLFENVVCNTGGPPNLIAMIDKYVDLKRPFDGMLTEAAKRVGLRHEPIQDNPHYYEVFAVSVSDVRRELFGMIDSCGVRSEIALKCLNVLDMVRDEYGLAENDSRHPDISSGRPWPLESSPPR